MYKFKFIFKKFLEKIVKKKISTKEKLHKKKVLNNLHNYKQFKKKFQEKNFWKKFQEKNFSKKIGLMWYQNFDNITKIRSALTQIAGACIKKTLHVRKNWPILQSTCEF